MKLLVGNAAVPLVFNRLHERVNGQHCFSDTNLEELPFGNAIRRELLMNRRLHFLGIAGYALVLDLKWTGNPGRREPAGPLEDVATGHTDLDQTGHRGVGHDVDVANRHVEPFLRYGCGSPPV